MRALQANKYWLVGCRKLVVETDAKYLKGMLSNPGVGLNATIMRWIEDVLLYHFTLRHVPGKNFGVDGLFRRHRQPGDEVTHLLIQSWWTTQKLCTLNIQLRPTMNQDGRIGNP
ncbi:hypothetical protein J132_09601 [Termitomyces sp. J132]|nr:hypothetical protein J132_09601 [Termitomyces sp. J132]